jgi:hypothetical protein
MNCPQILFTQWNCNVMNDPVTHTLHPHASLYMLWASDKCHFRRQPIPSTCVKSVKWKQMQAGPIFNLFSFHWWLWTILRETDIKKIYKKLQWSHHENKIVNRKNTPFCLLLLILFFYCFLSCNIRLNCKALLLKVKFNVKKIQYDLILTSRIDESRNIQECYKVIKLCITNFISFLFALTFARCARDKYFYWPAVIPVIRLTFSFFQHNIHK